MDRRVGPPGPGEWLKGLVGPVVCAVAAYVLWQSVVVSPAIVVVGVATFLLLHYLVAGRGAGRGEEGTEQR